MLLERKFSQEKCTFRLISHISTPIYTVFYYVYILQSLKDKSFYIDYTADLKKRFKGHNAGKNLATKPFRPYKLTFYEAFVDKKDAKNREIYLKSGWGFRSMKKILKNYLNRK